MEYVEEVGNPPGLVAKITSMDGHRRDGVTHYYFSWWDPVWRRRFIDWDYVARDFIDSKREIARQRRDPEPVRCAHPNPFEVLFK